MLSDYGLNAYLKAIGSPWSCRLWSSGCRIEQVFPCATGYPKVGDTDEANTNRGDKVLTWKYIIPRGTSWGRSPANEVDLLDGDNVVDHLKIPDLTTSADHPTVLYLNMVLRRQ